MALGSQWARWDLHVHTPLSLYQNYGGDTPGLLTLREAASLLDHNYFWLSRNYKRLQLRPVRISGKLLFTRKELEEALERHGARYRGRPPRPSLVAAT